jgi:DnaJ domain
MILRPLLSTTKTCLPSTLRPLTTSQCQSWRTRPPLPSPRLTKPFTSTSLLHDDQNHYDILGVSPTISPSDLKKRFYVLSRETHPDLHPKDPNANARFQSISESYSIISDPGNAAATTVKSYTPALPRATKVAAAPTRAPAPPQVSAGANPPFAAHRPATSATGTTPNNPAPPAVRGRHTRRETTGLAQVSSRRESLIRGLCITRKRTRI